MESFLVERWFAKYEFVAKINVAESGILPLKFNEIAKEIDPSLRLGYAESNGSVKLREEISNLYENLPKENVLVTTGASEALFLFFNTLVKNGDEIVVEFPGWQPFSSIPLDRGAVIKQLILDEEENWKVNIDKLNELVTKKTKVIVINHPHNPTGVTLTKRQLKEICEIAEDNNSYLLSDEVYRGLEFSIDTIPPAINFYDKAICIDSISKKYGLPGLRIGWLATSDKKVVEECWKLKDYTSQSCCILSEVLAINALQKTKELLSRAKRIAKINVKILSNWVDGQDKISCVVPKAGVIAFLKYNLSINSYDFCERLVKEKGVLLIPGQCFGIDKHLRIGFGGETKQLEDGLERIGEFIKVIR